VGPGAGKGIGRAIAEKFAAAGAHVVVNDIRADGVDAVVAAITASGGTAVGITADVSDSAQVATIFDTAIEAFGTVDVLVNNAGIVSPMLHFLEADEAWWRRIIDVNLTGAFLLAKHAIPHLRQRRGSIVNIASTRALQSEPNSEAYAATKGGLLALTHALAMSLGPDVRANSISPGWIDVTAWQADAPSEPQPLSATDHEQHPSGRVGKPEDVAAMVAYLVSPDAHFVTGQNFVIDGGMTRKMIYED
jgi:NAD(P)-dependent dehydrogenase (short-subunit alcohol dehydrogenase family)